MKVPELLIAARDLTSRLSSLQRSDISPLREVIRALNTAYYVNSSPLVSDSEYDALFRALKSLEDLY